MVLSKSRLCSYLLTSMIEWFTQHHYLEHMRDRGELDGLFVDLIKYHPREGRRTDAFGPGKGGDQAAHPSRLPLDVHRLGAGASQFREDRE